MHEPSAHISTYGGMPAHYWAALSVTFTVCTGAKDDKIWPCPYCDRPHAYARPGSPRSQNTHEVQSSSGAPCCLPCLR